jgi:hypothetical protein
MRYIIGNDNPWPMSKQSDETMIKTDFSEESDRVSRLLHALTIDYL